MLGPGIDNKFLENFMGDLDQDESMMDINTPNSMSTFDSSIIDPDEMIEMKNSFSPINIKTPQNQYSNNSTPSPTGDPMLMQPLMTQYSMSQNFTKVDPRTIQQQLAPNTNPPHNPRLSSPENNILIKPALTSTPNPTQTPIKNSTPIATQAVSGYCNIKPAPPRNSIPAVTSNVTQYQNVKPITIQQSNMSVLPQVVTVHSLSSKEKQPIFVQSPAVMYTTAKVQPITNNNATQVNISQLEKHFSHSYSIFFSTFTELKYIHKWQHIRATRLCRQ